MQKGARPGFLEMLDVDARRELMTRARTVRVRKGQSVLARSEAAGDVFIVQDGQLQVVLYAADGREVSLRELGAGQLFGELSAMDGQARSVGVVAASDARLLAIAPDAFRRAVLTNPEAADWLIRRLTTQVRGLTDRVFELSALNVRARLHCELLRLARSREAGSDAAPTHAELANRIGTHREAVTRELAVLAERNIIKAGRKRLEFIDVAGLEDVVATSLRAPSNEAGWW